MTRLRDKGAHAAREDDALLKRDADRSDYIILPLAGAVLAHLILVMHSAVGPADDELADLAKKARAILRSTGRKFDSAWHDDTRPYTRIEDRGGLTD